MRGHEEREGKGRGERRGMRVMRRDDKVSENETSKIKKMR